MGRFQDLDVYRAAFRLSLDVYRATAAFPRDERYGLVAQMRRAAVSVASCIAEGASRRTHGEFRNLLSSARGSAAELECQLALSLELGFLQKDEWAALNEQMARVRQMLHRLIASLAKRPR